jgi:glycerol-3-phosphate dehydrogenase subunit B
VTRVLVIGAGVAGAGAALAAARAGATVTMIDGGPGASSLATGALDALPWSDAGASAAQVGREAREILDAIGGHVLGPRGARLLTTAGLVRPARGREASLLDIDATAARDGAIGVIECERPGWDAKALAAAWGEGDREISFVPVAAAIERHTDERDLPDADFAARHDDDARLEWLAERLREAIGRSSGRLRALVLPPSLGLERARADALSDRVGVRCGEALALPGGPAGLRSERARRKALEGAGVEIVEARALGASRAGHGWTIDVDGGGRVDGDAVVFAVGGLIGGGLEYAPAEAVFATALPPFSRPPFRLGLDAPLPLGAHGRPLDLPSTLFGSAPEHIAWPFARDPLMERVGVLADAQGKVAQGLFAAGELLADRPRTWLDALSSGVAAGGAAGAVDISAERRSRSSFPAPPIRP